MAKDYYEILEVHPKASEEIIRKAYLTLAKKYHPDVSSEKDAEADLQKVHDKYIKKIEDLLSDKQTEIMTV